MIFQNNMAEASITHAISTAWWFRPPLPRTHLSAPGEERSASGVEGCDLAVRIGLVHGIDDMHDIQETGVKGRIFGLHKRWERGGLD